MAKKSILDDIIVQDKSEAASQEDDTLDPLLKEIDSISDESIRSFVRATLLKAELFWITPSGHSVLDTAPDEHGPGGNVLHTKRMVRVAEELCKSYSVTEEERDCVIAACLLHGVTKYFEDSSGQLCYNSMHAYTVGPFVVSCIESDKEIGNDAFSSTLFIGEESVQTILRLIRCHMGPWSPVPETLPITYLDYIVHIAHNMSLNIFKIIKDSDLINENCRII